VPLQTQRMRCEGIGARIDTPVRQHFSVSLARDRIFEIVAFPQECDSQNRPVGDLLQNVSRNKTGQKGNELLHNVRGKISRVNRRKEKSKRNGDIGQTPTSPFRYGMLHPKVAAISLFDNHLGTAAGRLYRIQAGCQPVDIQSPALIRPN